MTTNLLATIASPSSGRATALLLDHHAYAQSVFLRNQPVPWDDPASYARFFNQAQGLLKPDLSILDLNHFYTHHLEQNPTLRNAMSQKKRTGYALRVLLADKDLTHKAIDLAQTLTAMASGPVVLQIPSPCSGYEPHTTIRDPPNSIASTPTTPKTRRCTLPIGSATSQHFPSPRYFLTTGEPTIQFGRPRRLHPDHQHHRALSTGRRDA